MLAAIPVLVSPWQAAAALIQRRAHRLAMRAQRSKSHCNPTVYPRDGPGS